MADFHDLSRQKLADLSSPNADKRREAAYWLGEAGVDESITRLRTMYDDPNEDVGVREAARYALGMFKAVKEALDRGDEAKVLLLLRGIVDEGKFGRRRTTSPAWQRRVVTLLLVLFLILLGINAGVFALNSNPDLLVALNPGGGSDGDSTPSGSALPATNRDRAALVSEVRSIFDRTRADLTTLQGQYTAVLGGSALDCTAFFNIPAALALSDSERAAQGDLIALVDGVNAAHGQMTSAYDRYDQACFGNQPLDTSEVGGLLAPVQQALNTLADLEASLSGAEASLNAPTAAPNSEASAAPAVTEALPTAIPPTTDPQPYLAPLFNIIDTVSNPRGPGGLLQQYWTDAFNAGVTDGCDTPRPDIPADYLLPATNVPEAMTQAVVQVNIGLGQVRQGWDLFEAACASGRLTQDAVIGLDLAENAANAFSNANTLLNSLN